MIIFHTGFHLHSTSQSGKNIAWSKARGDDTLDEPAQSNKTRRSRQSQKDEWTA